MNRLAIMGAVVGLQLLAGAAAAAEQRCATPYLPSSELPHGGFSDYDRLKHRAARIASCDKVSPLDYCHVLDPWGYTDTFSDVTRVPEFTGPKKRYLVKRTAHRQHGAQLPYGVLWSDGAGAVSRKLKALGLDPQGGLGEAKVGVEVLVNGCARDRVYPGFLTTFVFDRAGRLQSVTREDEPES